MILLDTSGLLAWIDGSQRHHAAVASSMQSFRGPYLLSPFVLAEIDYLLATRVGSVAQHAFLQEVARGAYRLESFSAPDVRQALKVMEQYRDLQVGLADASIVVLAERHEVFEVLTLDERHFRVLQTSGGPFRVLPADE